MVKPQPGECLSAEQTWIKNPLHFEIIYLFIISKDFATLVQIYIEKLSIKASALRYG